MKNPLACFKAYDARGNVPEEINPELCRALGAAIVAAYAPAHVVIGHDTRLSSPELSEAIVESLLNQGVNVSELGLCGTEELYYATARGNYDFGVMVTASHNPPDQNGFKFVERGAVPVSNKSGLQILASLTAKFLKTPPGNSNARGRRQRFSMRSNYIDWLLDYSGFAPESEGQQLRVVADAGNGCAGPVLELLAKRIPIEFISLNFEPDGTFPNGMPNPLLPEKRLAAAQAVRKNAADIGVAFDGDFDRCFFFDHNGNFVESCYLIGLLASGMLVAHPGEKIVHDTRVYWATRDLIIALGGIPVMSRGGHTCMKDTMRQENAIYGGEMSGHHFYRDFAYCDSGMLTMLILISLLRHTGQRLSELVEAGIAAYPCSGEINFRGGNGNRIMETVWQKYRRNAVASDRLDGISLEYPEWRFNLRASNTEPLLRLNIESRGNPELVQKKLGELTKFINAQIRDA